MRKRIVSFAIAVVLTFGTIINIPISVSAVSHDNNISSCDVDIRPFEWGNSDVD